VVSGFSRVEVGKDKYVSVGGWLRVDKCTGPGQLGIGCISARLSPAPPYSCVVKRKANGI
jgi:hypothetical protein